MTVVVHSFAEWLPLTQTWNHNLIRHLPDAVESHVVCRIASNLERFPVDHLHALADGPAWRHYGEKVLRRLGLRSHQDYLAERIGATGAGIVHSHFGDVGFCDLEAVRRTGVRHVVTFYGLDVNHLPRTEPAWLDRYLDLFSTVDLVLCEGSHMAGCVQRLGCPADRLRVHHIGVSTQGIAYAPRRWTPGEPLKVLIASSFVEKKGIPYALQALARLREELPLEVTLIGDARDHPRFLREKERILRLLETSGLSGITRRLGYQPHDVFLREAYAHHLFLSPSVTSSDHDTEGGAPVSLIDMAASGMPIVSSRHCDIPEVIEHGVTGRLADERDVDGLVHEIRWWLEHPDRWEDMLRAGRARVEREFDVAVQARRLAELYREVEEEEARSAGSAARTSTDAVRVGSSRKSSPE